VEKFRTIIDGVGNGCGELWRGEVGDGGFEKGEC